MSKEAIEHYEAALKEAFPSGATGDVFHHWNEARKALAEQPAPMIRGDIRDGLVDDEPAQPAQQQMPDDWFKGMPEEYRRAAWRIKEQPAQSSKPWVGLEPGEISKIATSDQLAWANLNTVENRQYFARAIEAKLKEKNT